ncbi:hypothetical protein D3C86_1335100 [compost metagenome]
MQHHADFRGAGDGAVLLVAHIGEDLAGVLIDVQGGIVARVIGEHGDGEYAGGGGREGDAVTRFDLALGGDVLHVLQADGRRGRAGLCATVGHVFGVIAGHWHRCVFHRPWHGLAGGAVEAASLDIGLRYVIPHRRRKDVPNGRVLLAPEAGPGHAAEQHHQQQGRAPETGDGVQVAPQYAAATAQTGPQNSRRLTARPPQEHPGNHQHHAPTGGHFNQPVTDGANHQLAVDRPRDCLQVFLGVLLAKDVAVVRIDEYVQFVASVEHDKLRAAFGVHRWQVLLDRALWIRVLDALEQVVGRDRVMAGGDVEQTAVHQRVKLRLEQVNGAGQGQHHHEWRNEQSGIEMPAPGQVVEIHFGLFHHVCSAWLGSFSCVLAVAAQPIASRLAPSAERAAHETLRNSCPPSSRACAPVP